MKKFIKMHVKIFIYVKFLHDICRIQIYDWLIDWCLMSSEQFFSYIQDEKKKLNATGIETRKGDGYGRTI
jgi:hypothetical protein